MGKQPQMWVIEWAAIESLDMLPVGSSICPRRATHILQTPTDYDEIGNTKLT
ncbi:hypothetical protein [Chamaesiphon sp. VAR_48_metabat_403]|uniref:hypothetical protein n=1 Tax=Chamaesiphon sp. VAR_48_metabat_403 TaxID=2964700 RepID=UPI00286E4629|nr:hypothetical protein [Chamaesiphon sp. VAR_48_metabat_403]